MRQQVHEENKNEFMEKVIKINRVTKVVKGGKRLSFRALVIIGDMKGRVAVCLGKASEVPSAIKKAIERGKKNLLKVNLTGGTIPHEVIGEFGAAKVILRPASPGHGVIAGGSVRIVLEAVGVRDVVAKSLGSSNQINNARAALEGLSKLKSYSQACQERGQKLPVQIFSGSQERRKQNDQPAAATQTVESKSSAAKEQKTTEKPAAKKPASKIVAKKPKTKEG